MIQYMIIFMIPLSLSCCEKEYIMSFLSSDDTFYHSDNETASTHSSEDRKSDDYVDIVAAESEEIIQFTINYTDGKKNKDLSNRQSTELLKEQIQAVQQELEAANRRAAKLRFRLATLQKNLKKRGSIESLPPLSPRTSYDSSANDHMSPRITEQRPHRSFSLSSIMSTLMRRNSKS